MVNISWRRSAKDDQEHAFDVEQIASPRSLAAEPSAAAPSARYANSSTPSDGSSPAGTPAANPSYGPPTTYSSKAIPVRGFRLRVRY